MKKIRTVLLKINTVIVLPVIIICLFLFTSCFLVKPRIEKVNGPGFEISQNEATFIWKGRIPGSFDGYLYKKDDGVWTNTNKTAYTWTEIAEGFHSFAVKGKYGGGKETEATKWEFQYTPDYIKSIIHSD